MLHGGQLIFIAAFSTYGSSAFMFISLLEFHSEVHLTPDLEPVPLIGSRRLYFKVWYSSHGASLDSGLVERMIGFFYALEHGLLLVGLVQSFVIFNSSS